MSAAAKLKVLDQFKKDILSKLQDCGDDDEKNVAGAGPAFYSTDDWDVSIGFVPKTSDYYHISGWLPSKEVADAWFKRMQVSLDPKDWVQSVQDFYDVIRYHSNIRQAVATMIAIAIEKNANTPIQSVEDMCGKLDKILKMTPQYSTDSGDELIGVPMAALFADVAANSPGMAIFLSQQFNAPLYSMLQEWMAHLDDPASFTVDNNGFWLSDAAKKQYEFDNYVTELPKAPYWTSWNAFFTRDFKAGVRPNKGEGDNSKIQTTNDGTQFRYSQGVPLKQTFWLKDMPYSLQDIFGFDFRAYPERFVNGSVFQSYLDPFNYHNYVSPVDGSVVAYGVMEGALFPQLVWEYKIPDPGAGTLSLPWLAEVNARGIFVIDTAGFADIGYVCMVAIGMGEVSSVNWYRNKGVTEEDKFKKGDAVQKGEKVGCFKFGGSSIAVIFEDAAKYKKQIKFDPKFSPSPESGKGAKFNVGEILATIEALESNE